MGRRHTAITVFVVCWSLVFHYESLRANYLIPLTHHHLPKIPLLFPPAGWIMFFNIEPSYSIVEVYGLRGEQPVLLDPHEILSTRFVGYDNIHRNVLISVLSPAAVGTPAQCRQAQQSHPRDYAAAVLLGLCGDPPDRPIAQLPFCRYLQSKFPEYDGFVVAYAQYPDLINTPQAVRRQAVYQCLPSK
jgi:hypothetical protein